MVSPVAAESSGETITRLQARVAALERALEDRSRFVRRLARVLCEDDLTSFSRLVLGMGALPRAGFGLRGWSESTSPSMGDVDKTMSELWRSVAPPVLEEEL